MVFAKSEMRVERYDDCVDLDAGLVSPADSGGVEVEYRTAIAEFTRLSPVERFDQLVRTARFIESGRCAVRRALHG